MKFKCPICNAEGFLQIRGSSARVQHYKGFINGKRKYEYHKIPKELIPSILEVNPSKTMEVKKPENSPINVYWWARGDLNARPTGYEPVAPTRLSYGPTCVNQY